MPTLQDGGEMRMLYLCVLAGLLEVGRDLSSPYGSVDDQLNLLTI